MRNDWDKQQVADLFALPFNDLLFEAQKVHRENFKANEVQASTLLSIKTGGCPEDCKYCPQSAHFETPVKASKMIDVGEVVEAARVAKNAGATRFCMGAAWRSPKERDMQALSQMIAEVKALGLETCMTLGMLSSEQADALHKAGLDYYNHNIDSSKDFYEKIITTRTYDERLQTLENVRKSGMKTCCGGIVGMGESRADRVAFLHQLATLPTHPESVPINMLVQVKGTPLYGEAAFDELEFVRTIAVARLLMPKSYVRLSAGREQMSESMHALCFMAGANSIFFGETLLTTANPQMEKDLGLLSRLGMELESTII
jgi:biotin synthase